MHCGVFVGAKVNEQNKRILILGESHHISNDKNSPDQTNGVQASYRTSDVVETYIQGSTDSSLVFFKKIGNSFGFSMETVEDRHTFWSRFYFGNYIDVLCGIKDSSAKTQINNRGRIELNNQLFEFINANNIDIVVCFSRLAFNSLPSYNSDEEDKGIIKNGITVGKTSDYIYKCEYQPNVSHNNVQIVLQRPLEVYGVRHPSAWGGFKAENYADVLKKLF